MHRLPPEWVDAMQLSPQLLRKHDDFTPDLSSKKHCLMKKSLIFEIPV